jgi:hypothetical protein
MGAGRLSHSANVQDKLSLGGTTVVTVTCVRRRRSGDVRFGKAMVA